jgi:SAM-dependent methyltransferase
MQSMKWLAPAHRALAFDRRARVLSERLVSISPPNSKILDIGCGDGSIDRLMLAKRPDLTIEGIDVMVRDRTRIPVKAFDGRTINLADGTFDYCMLVDVLHHTTHPQALLAEALRISRRGLIVKDHLADGFLSRPTLRLMDWVGNAPHGVALPYNYLDKAQWISAFDSLGLRSAAWLERLRIYPLPLTFLFDRKLHFLARLEKGEHDA